MDPALNASSSSTPTRGHGRSPSGDARRRGAPRHLTKGPLDQADVDPLSSSIASIPTPSSPAQVPSPALKSRSPRPGIARSPTRPAEDASTKDFTFLTRPENFHALPVGAIPEAFQDHGHAPASNTPLDVLINRGQFHTAAIVAAQQLVSLPLPLDLSQLFDLLHCRFASLTMINQTGLAASESKILGDMSSSFYRSRETGLHIAPWDLRVLAVRLQVLGFDEWRRGIMQYYMLAAEARRLIMQARQAFDRAAETMWTGRLRDLGIRVASVLVEMGDAEAAGRQLRTLDLEADLSTDFKRRVVFMEALVWLRLGDLRAARRCIYRLRGRNASSNPTSPSVEVSSWDAVEDDSDKKDDFSSRVLSALVRTAEGDFALAVEEWKGLHREAADDAMVSQNLAVCLLYTGHFAEAKDMLESSIENEIEFKPLLFNLCTIYEICTERARDLKVNLTAKVAQMSPSADGWERAAVDFKL